MARRVLDQYFTPPPVVRAIVPALQPWIDAGLTLEPACGDGVIASEAIAAGGQVLAIDIDPLCVARAKANLTGATVVQGDFLKMAADLRRRGIVPSLIWGNPPYGKLKGDDMGQAEQFLRASLDLVSPVGAVAFLLRIGFTASRGRARLISDHTPDQHTLAERPSFTGGRGTDPTEYAWFVWPRSRRPGQPGYLRLLSRDGALVEEA